MLNKKRELPCIHFKSCQTISVSVKKEHFIVFSCCESFEPSVSIHVYYEVCGIYPAHLILLYLVGTCARSLIRLFKDTVFGTQISYFILFF